MADERYPDESYPTVGAYSRRAFRRTTDGSWEATGSLDQWKGSLADVAKAASLATEDSPNATVTGTVTLATGESVTFDTVESLAAAATEIAPDAIETIRVEVNEQGRLRATVVARDRLPAVLIEVAGRERSRVLGLGQLMAGRLSRGYVDPLGTLRALALMVASFLPLGIGVVATGNDLHGWGTPVRIAFGVGIVASTFGMLAVAPRLLRKRRNLVLVTTSPEPGRSAAARLRALSERKWSKRVLYVAGVLLLGVLGNKLADWLPV